MAIAAARYGWLPDLPDQRDHLFAAAPGVLTELPRSVDLRPECPPVYDQGDINSCTANAIAAAVEFDLMREKLDSFMPSRLFIYWNERVIEHSTKSDSGAHIRDGIKSVAKAGYCPETDWPYAAADLYTEPSTAAVDKAKPHHITSYQRVARDLAQMKGCLASGYVFAFGFTVYNSFESEQVRKSGELDMPQQGESVIGGHAVVAVGYDDSDQRFIVRNSWGDKWGLAGYFTMPYAYLTQRSLSSDFWRISVAR
ncbi:MAG TPA: C1 family peptidase [Acidimicrobiia bacterium]|jgi:C1A family cysteine protease